MANDIVRAANATQRREGVGTVRALGDHLLTIMRPSAYFSQSVIAAVTIIDTSRGPRPQLFGSVSGSWFGSAICIFSAEILYLPHKISNTGIS